MPQRAFRIFFAPDFSDKIDDVRKLVARHATKCLGRGTRVAGREKDGEQITGGYRPERRFACMVEQVEDYRPWGHFRISVPFAWMYHEEIALLQERGLVRVYVLELA